MSIAARAFSFSLIAIFIPIYLYNLGYNLAIIALFFIVMQAARLCVTPWAGLLLARFGAKHLMAVSQLFSIAFIILLAVGSTNIGLLLLAAVVRGTDLGIFWLSYHFNFSSVRVREKTSWQVGVMFMLLSVMHALGPLLGGIIATQVGIQYGFLVAAIFLLVAAYAIMRTPEQAAAVRFEWQDIRRNWRRMRRDVTANGANSFQTEIGVHCWPLFIFLFLGTYQTVGLVVSLSLVASIAAIYLIGRRGDRGKNRQQIHIGSRGTSLVHLSRPFAQSLGSVVGVNVVNEVVSNFYKIPFLSYYYQNASDASNRLAYIVRMEMAGSAGNIAAWSAVLLLALLLPLKLALIFAFICAAGAVLLNTKIVPLTKPAPGPALADAQKA